MGVCYLMEYFIMTKKQKRFLEKTFACLNISTEDLMKIKKIEEIQALNEQYKRRIEFLEEALKINNEALLKINGQVTEMAKEITNMQNEEIWGGKLNE